MQNSGKPVRRITEIIWPSWYFIALLWIEPETQIFIHRILYKILQGTHIFESYHFFLIIHCLFLSDNLRWVHPDLRCRPYKWTLWWSAIPATEKASSHGQWQPGGHSTKQPANRQWERCYCDQGHIRKFVHFTQNVVRNIAKTSPRL